MKVVGPSIKKIRESIKYVKVGAQKFSERQALGTGAKSDKDYKEAPPAPLFEPGELKSWSFYRAGIAEFVATFLFLYITVLTVMGVNRAPNKCSSVGIQGIAWAFGGMIFFLMFFKYYIGVLTMNLFSRVCLFQFTHFFKIYINHPTKKINKYYYYYPSPYAMMCKIVLAQWTKSPNIIS